MNVIEPGTVVRLRRRQTYKSGKSFPKGFVFVTVEPEEIAPEYDHEYNRETGDHRWLDGRWLTIPSADPFFGWSVNRRDVEVVL